MKSLLSLVLLGAAVLAVPTANPGSEVDAPPTKEADASATTSYVVILKDEVTDVLGHINSLHLPNAVSATYDGAIKGYTGEFNALAMTLIRADPLVQVIQLNQEHSGSVEQRFSGYGLAISSQLITQAPGSQTEYFYDHNGFGVVVYVADSGVQANNPDFGGRAVNAANFVTRQYGMADEPNYDTHGHGTAVSGCVAGQAWGIAKRANIRSIKVLNYVNRGTTAAIVAGINYAINDCRGRKCVLNLSLGGPSDGALDHAAATANFHGITTIVAAGNDNINACHVSPAGSPSVVTVGAIDSLYRRADFSNFGQCVDIFAPGVEIQTDSYRYPNQISLAINGTSFSSPYVAGIAALYLGAGLTTPADVKAALRQYGMKNVVTDLRGSNDLLANNGYFFGL